MLLKSTNNKDARDEKELRQWLVNEIGEEDQRILVEWVWEKQRGELGYVAALALIVRDTEAHGPAFLRNLLDHAKKPKEVREAEEEIREWVKPHVEEAARIARLHNADPNAVAEERNRLLYKLEEKLYNMFPHKHRATMKGAMITALSTNGAFELNVSRLVEALFMQDPLAATAASSR